MVGKGGRKLFERAKNSPYGWHRSQLDSLYHNYGFIIECKSKHDIVKHPDFPDLRATLTRSSSDLHPDYVRHAVEMIEILLKRIE